MEFLRSCYRSEWNLPNHGLVRGQYYFCPDGTPLFPYPHFLNSRNWHQGDYSEWPEFGETQAAQQIWTNGGLPLLFPRPVQLGPGSCIGAPVDGVEQPPATGLLWGYDLRCWAVAPLETAAGGLALGGVARTPGEFAWGGLGVGGLGAELGEAAAGGLGAGGLGAEPAPTEAAAGGLGVGGLGAEPGEAAAGGLGVGGTSAEGPPGLGLVLWLRADLQVYKDGGVTLAVDGDTIQQWNDQSATHSNANQATTANKPVYHTGRVNGKPAVTFAGSPHVMTFATTNLIGYHFAVVLNQVTAVHLGGVFNYRGIAQNGCGLEDSTVGGSGSFDPLNQSFLSTPSNTLTRATSGLVANGTFHLCEGNSTGAIWINAAATTTVSGASASPTIAGLLGEGTSGYFNGEIAEILVYSGTLSNADRAALENYIRAKYAVW